MIITSEKLIRNSERQAVAAFKRAAQKVPFYKTCLKQLNINPDRINTIQDFKNTVPILDKEKLFTSNLSDIKNICAGGALKGLRSILPSSGYSGNFSFGLNTENDLKKQAEGVDLILDYTFDVAHKKTLLVNSLCMGINIPSAKAVLINTGPRADIALAVVKTFAKEFDQIIIVGDNCLLKNLIEKGAERGFKWPDYDINIILGGDSFPENFRAYLAHLLGIRLDGGDKRIIGSSFGIAEIGLNLLWETRKTIQIRRRACVDKALRKELFAEDGDTCPMLAQYNPFKIYLEEADGHLILTTLEPGTKLPLVRYRTGDLGSVISFDKLNKTLNKFGLSEYLPYYKLPLACVRGRDEYLDFNGRRIYPDLVKNALYGDFELPKFITGYFAMKKSGQQLNIELQLKEGVRPEEELKNKFRALLSGFLKTDLQLIFYPYRDFPYGMELDYERKFQYICEC